MANIASGTTSGRIEIASRYPHSNDASLIPIANTGNKKIGPGAKLVYSKLLDHIHL